MGILLPCHRNDTLQSEGEKEDRTWVRITVASSRIQCAKCALIWPLSGAITSRHWHTDRQTCNCARIIRISSQDTSRGDFSCWLNCRINAIFWVQIYCTSFGVTVTKKNKSTINTLNPTTITNKRKNKCVYKKKRFQ